LLYVFDRLAHRGVGLGGVRASLEVQLEEGEHTSEVVSLQWHVRQVLFGGHTKVVVYTRRIELLKAFFVTEHLMSAWLKLQGGPQLLSACLSLIQVCNIDIVKPEPTVCRIKRLERGEGKIEAFSVGV
jgi:hypothetical protein